MTRNSAALSAVLAAFCFFISAVKVSAEDGIVDRDWFERAVQERRHQLLLGQSPQPEQSGQLVHGTLIINKRYMLDVPIQASFLHSSPKQSVTWWYDSPFESLNEHFVLDNRFSRGGCGEVWFARDLRDRSRRLVLKRVFPEKILSGLREVHFGERLRNELHVTRFVESFNRTSSTGEHELWLVFEEEGTSLKNLLYESGDGGPIRAGAFWRKMRESGTRGFAVRREIARQVLKGLAVLAADHIVHRDIKPGNILISHSTVGSPIMVKLGDFGSAIDNQVVAKGLFGSSGPTREDHTKAYEPPEFRLFPHNQHLSPELLKFSFDAWSLGVLLLEMILGKDTVFDLPESAKRRRSRKKSIGQNADDFLSELVDFGLDDEEKFGEAVRFADPYGQGFGEHQLLSLFERNFVFRLLSLRPTERLSFVEALDHPYLTTPLDDEHLDLSRVRKQNIKFKCGQCERVFHSFISCDSHARARGHRVAINDTVHPERGLCLALEDPDPLESCSTYTIVDADSVPHSPWCGNSGGKAYSEDFYTATPSRNVVVVADGHWGEHAARVSCRVLRESVQRTMKECSEPEECLQKMKGDFQSLQSLLEDSPDDRDSGAAVTVVAKKGNMIYVANVGDARAIACCSKDGSLVVLTKDHVASLQEERDRVAGLEGGFVEFVNGRFRVQGRLALTRALGDVAMRPYISAEPYLLSLNVTDSSWRFIVVATDGVFDAVPNDEVVAIVRMEHTKAESLVPSNREDSMDQNSGTQEEGTWFTRAALRIVHEARARDITQDNLGAAVIPLV